MDRDGRHTEGGREVLADSNVVRLPRDWLGPREELIPFGPSTDERADDEGQHIELPPTADDFWGEGSASVQDAFQAPTDRAAPLPKGTRIEVAGVAGLGRITRAGARVARHRRARPLSLLGLAAVSVLTILILVSAGTPKPGVRKLLANGAGRTSAGSTAQAPRSHRVGALEETLRHRTRGRASLGQSQGSSGRGARSRTAHRTAQHSGLARASTATVQRVRYTSPAPPDAGNGTTSSPPASASTPPASPSSGTGGQTHSTASQPALGANGALGPGSSPDG